MDVLTTVRLRLRRLTLDDTDRLLEVLGDPVAMAHYPAPKSRDDVERWITWATDSYKANGFGLWAIERIDDGAFLGDCGPMLQPVGGALLPEIGYHLVRRAWGQGYATEAAAAALAWVFRETAHGRACSIVSPRNEPSQTRRCPHPPHPGAVHLGADRDGDVPLLDTARRVWPADHRTAIRGTSGGAVRARLVGPTTR